MPFAKLLRDGKYRVERRAGLLAEGYTVRSPEGEPVIYAKIPRHGRYVRVQRGSYSGGGRNYRYEELVSGESGSSGHILTVPAVRDELDKAHPDGIPIQNIADSLRAVAVEQRAAFRPGRVVVQRAGIGGALASPVKAS